jgi:hypothetical protein
MSQTNSNQRAPSALAEMSLMLVFFAAAVTAATAAGGPPADLKSAPVGVPAPRTVANWSHLTSEELPPLTTFNGTLISAMQCTGRYCDNVALGYEPVPGVNYNRNGWTPYFSEEGTNWQICDGNDSFMTGISCQGSYCDNVSLQCTQVLGKTKGSCAWQPWFSEEAQYSILPQGYYAAGLACRGDYCDDFSIFACQAL